MDKQKNEDISFEKQTQRFSGEDVKTTLRDIKSVSQFRDGRKWLTMLLEILFIQLLPTVSQWEFVRHETSTISSHEGKPLPCYNTQFPG